MVLCREQDVVMMLFCGDYMIHGEVVVDVVMLYVDVLCVVRRAD